MAENERQDGEVDWTNKMDYDGQKHETKQQPTKSMQEVIMEVVAMGYDPLAKRNGTGADYTETLHHDTYDLIQPEQWNLKGRAVFVTGASRGIGRAFAVTYAKAGVSYIAIGARSPLAEVEKEIQKAAKDAGRPAPKILAVKLDVTSKESVAEVAREVEAAFGRLDILVNNSGYMEKQVSMTEVEPEDWWHAFEVNIFGMFLVSRAFLPLLLKNDDGLKTVVSLTSMWGLTKFADGSAYQMTKFATLRFTDLLLAENAHKGLRAFNYHPGGVDTDLASGLNPDIQQFLVDTPALAADTLVWLTSERRDWLSGRYLSAQWDMQEMLDKKEKIVKEDHLKMRLAVGLD